MKHGNSLELWGGLLFFCVGVVVLIIVLVFIVKAAEEVKKYWKETVIAVIALSVLWALFSIWQSSNK